MCVVVIEDMICFINGSVDTKDRSKRGNNAQYHGIECGALSYELLRRGGVQVSGCFSLRLNGGCQWVGTYGSRRCFGRNGKGEGSGRFSELPVVSISGWGIGGEGRGDASRFNEGSIFFQSCRGKSNGRKVWWLKVIQIAEEKERGDGGTYQASVEAQDEALRVPVQVMFFLGPWLKYSVKV